ncbi:glycosyltransferase family 33 protein [Paxillus rubicundulus Ve08.2h10]|uniref:Chitobiosyldiphosphodolichol beta-mannosyltransferase n=1 Tax=Paxillus rubicundulus Ve08.2h10 TaxID=930991 RepID=A0A0D0E1X6_9AGAM|nr:glycosyltransferase family 33 protein [Paxillus rubicundulus Ve08.2h10]
MPMTETSSTSNVRTEGFVVILAAIILVQTYQYVKRLPRLRSVAIIVLGDIGRSPRMMYHAESFAKLEFSTYLIGYRGSKPVPSLTSLPHVRLCYLAEPPSFLAKVPFVLAAPAKIVHQVISILYTLLFAIHDPPEFIMVQNPPSVPTLALVWMVGHVRGSKIIIDWHNLGYSILALKLGKSHPIVNIAKRFETTFGRSAYAHLFVTNAMQDHLVAEWGLLGKKVVLHDRPPSHFHRCSPSEVHELFLRLGPSLTSPSLRHYLPAPNKPYTTQFTTTAMASSHIPLPITDSSPNSNINMPELRTDRVALLVSSTSWTPDEDFIILLDALKLYEARAAEVNAVENPGKLPRIWMVITGKGPLKANYMAEIERLQEKWEFVRCSSLWLEAEDYPLLLGSADLGISLHSSSSALDLPMKVVDMFGCGLPVCALDFACLPELVKHGQNGLVFRNAEQLADQMEMLLTSFPNATTLGKLRSSLWRASQTRTLHPVQHTESADWEWGTWADNWNRVVKPLVLKDVERFNHMT